MEISFHNVDGGFLLLYHHASWLIVIESALVLLRVLGFVLINLGQLQFYQPSAKNFTLNFVVSRHG